MSREAWYLVKHNKNFNVRLYRRGITVLIFSLILNGVLGLFIFRSYLSQPERDYYATSGVTPPVQLHAMLSPNNSAQALLEPDPPTDDVVREIPQ